MRRLWFADTNYWVGLVNKRDQYHARAQAWARVLSGVVVTTEAVLIETGNSLSKPPLRAEWLALHHQIRTRSGFRIMPLTDPLLARGWDRYASRADKAWSVTDCISFVVMGDHGLLEALTADDHFRQAGFVPLLQSDPPEAAP